MSAGVGAMTYARFFLFNLVGALAWIVSLCLAGYFFGNLPWVKQNLSLVIVGIIVVSMIPLVVSYFRGKKQPA